jgi:hypothetical protein
MANALTSSEVPSFQEYQLRVIEWIDHLRTMDACLGKSILKVSPSYTSTTCSGVSMNRFSSLVTDAVASSSHLRQEGSKLIQQVK